MKAPCKIALKETGRFIMSNIKTSSQGAEASFPPGCSVFALLRFYLGILIGTTSYAGGSACCLVSQMVKSKYYGQDIACRQREERDTLWECLLIQTILRFKLR